jgi:hypothetical protein
MKNFWIKEKKKYAEMRLGGMTAGSLHIELPAYFKWLGETCYSFNGITMFCQSCKEDEAELCWVDDFKVKLKGRLAKHLGYEEDQEIELVYGPSCRTLWYSFTLPEKKYEKINS